MINSSFSTGEDGRLFAMEKLDFSKYCYSAEVNYSSR